MGEIRSTKDNVINEYSGIICGICGNSINGNEEIELCPECVSPFHKVCWDKRGGCGNPNCSSFVKPVTDFEDATAKVVSLIIIKAKESLAKKEFDKALEFYKKALEYDFENVEAINGLILAENSVCSTKELLKKEIEFEKSDSYKTYAQVLPEEKKKFFEELIQNRYENQEKKKKKRKIVVIVASALAVILVAVCIWFATPMSRFNFEINENYVEITGVKFKNMSNVVIPEKIFGKPVTSIGNFAFLGCTSLTSVVIPNSVTSIGDYTFWGCTSLTSVVIPNSVALIGNYAFEDCTSLTSVVIPNSVIWIGTDAFYNCTGLTRVDISDIGAWCNISFGNSYANPLRYAKNLYLNGEIVTDLVIPNSVTTIGKYAFWGCTSLSSVVIPNSVTLIGYFAFEDCTYLTIYCEAESKPSNWDAYWNSSFCPVVWGYTMQPEG